MEALTSKNWHTWKGEIQNLLLFHNCKEFISTTIEIPSPIPAEDANYANLLEKQSRQNKALALIYANVSSEIKPILEGVSTPKVAWDRLERYFHPYR